MFLYIARHAWAGERGDPRWPDDSLRELTPDGIERYTKVVKVARRSRLQPRPHRHQSLHPLPADGRDHRQVRRRQTDDRRTRSPRARLRNRAAVGMVARTQGDANICWVGHSPDVERLAAELIGDGTARIRFAKGAIAAIGFEAEINAGAGELYWLATAKLAGSLIDWFGTSREASIWC